MSVINTMLRNLEERRAGVAGNAGLLDELSIPVRGQRFVPRIFVLGPLVVCAAAAATLYFWPRAEAAGSVAAVARLSPQDAGNRQLVAKAPTVFTPQQAVSSSQGDDARGMKGAGDSSETAADIALVLATSMAEAGDAAAGTRADKPVRRSFAKDDSAFVKVVSKPTGTVPEPRQLPAAEALPAAARQASPAAVAESGAIRVEQSTQTPAERNLMEVQHAAELQRRGSVVEAEASLRGVLANDRTMLAARQALFALLQRQQRFDEARALLREGVAIAPTQAALLLPYARLLAARGEWAAAYDALAPAAEVLAQDAEYRGLCGAVLQRLGRFPQSVADYRAAVKLAPTASAWWVGLGLSLESDGRSGEARGAYLQARATPLSSELAQFVDNRLARPVVAE